jgi:hypothetical protein
MSACVTWLAARCGKRDRIRAAVPATIALARSVVLIVE